MRSALRGRSQVLIVGAGPAGCAAGITLARAGVEVCVVDRARFPRPKTCGDAISNRALERIEQLGALPAITSGPHALVRRADAVFPDGSRVGRTYQRPGMIVPRLQLDAALLGALRESGARVVEGTAVRALEEPADHGGGYQARGPALDWRAELVIAADGPGSVAWSALGRVNPRGRSLAVAATQYFEGVEDLPGGVSEHYFEHELPCGYGWVFPSVDGVVNVGVYQRADAYQKTEDHLRALLKGFLERHQPRLAGARPVGPARSWSLPLGPAPWGVGGRDLLLVGDAGFSVDPLSGEGIWQALETGIMAAETARDALGAGGLGPRLQRAHARRCARKIGMHCRVRAAVQDGMQWFVDRRLYRSAWARAGLQWAYGRGALEQSKSVR